MILVSACLLGENCKYTGGNNRSEKVLAHLAGKDYIPFCPEQAGGLSTPRAPSEIRDDRVFSDAGEDVTEQFRRGAEKTLAFCRQNAVDRAILKARSPSCGVHQVYDGTFSGRAVPGMGVTARLLAENGVALMDEEDIKHGI